MRNNGKEKKLTKEVIKQNIHGCHNEDNPRWDGKQTFEESREIFSPEFLSYLP
jgi:hypothetical protein